MDHSETLAHVNKLCRVQIMETQYAGFYAMQQMHPVIVNKNLRSGWLSGFVLPNNYMVFYLADNVRLGIKKISFGL